MIDTRSTPKTGETTTLWLIKILTGPILVIVALVHVWINHTAGSAAGNLMTFEDILVYYQNPLIPLMEIIFLVSVVAHSLLGLRGIILDLKPGAAALKLWDGAFVVLGAGSVLYGVWLIFAILAYV